MPRDNISNSSTPKPVGWEDLPPEMKNEITGYFDPKMFDSLGKTNKKNNQFVGSYLRKQHRNLKCFVGIHAVFLYNSTHVYACGNNEHGKLGLGHTKDQKLFQRVLELNIQKYGGVADIQAASKCAFIRCNDGTVLAAGLIFDEHKGYKNRFLAVPDIQKHGGATSMHAGWGFIFILCNDGTVWALGDNQCGQLGLGHTEAQNLFKQVTGIQEYGEAAEIHTGDGCTFIRFKNGKVLATGNNSKGQLGLSHYLNQNRFVEVTDIQKYGGAADIQTNADCTFIRCNNGKVLVTGKNSNGQLGLGHNRNQNRFVEVSDFQKYGGAVEIRVGERFTFVRCKNGTVLAAGTNSHGQLGLGWRHILSAYKNRFVPVPGIQKYGGAAEIHPGANFTFILCNDGTVLATGWNLIGQLGLGHEENQEQFVPVPGIQDHGGAAAIQMGILGGTIIHCKDGTLLAGGDNAFGRLGLGHDNCPKRFVRTAANLSHVTCMESLIRKLEKETKYALFFKKRKQIKLSVLQELTAQINNSDTIKPEHLTNAIQKTKEKREKQGQKETEEEIQSCLISGFFNSRTKSLLSSIELLPEQTAPVQPSDEEQSSATAHL